MTSPVQPSEPAVAERVFRSPAGIAGGVLLLALAAWLGGDALIRGTGRTPWVGLAALILVVPMIVAFTLRPAVYADSDRLRIRNPFRTITIPWGAVKDLRARYATEVFTEGERKFQLWAVPVSLRQRKRASNRQARMDRGISPLRTPMRPGAAVPEGGVQRAQADRTVSELKELAERATQRPDAQGAPVVRWSYEVIGPALAGLIVLLVLLATG